MYSAIKRLSILLLVVSTALLSGTALAKGLDPWAKLELSQAGVDKYLGKYTPVSTEAVGDGWLKHTFDSAGGEGPICIDGSTYSVFTRKGKDAKNLLIMLQGGGACWQGAIACTENVAGNPLPPAPPQGIWDFGNKGNPFRRYSIVYMPYCDGSVFGGDNRVIDPSFDSASGDDGVRHHRGLRNLSAGMDVAKATFKKVKKVTVAGSSAGGVGATAFAPLLVRFQYGNKLKHLTVFNDAGPLAMNLDAVGAVEARAKDWDFAKFYPASCTDCSAYRQQTAIISWRMANDNSVREAFYETDADATNIGFASVNLPGNPPFMPVSQNQYRDIVLDAHDPIAKRYPNRYKRFIVSGDVTHTALQLPLFYSQTANGVPLNQWTRDFLGNKKGWVDIVEDFVAAPSPF